MKNNIIIFLVVFVTQIINSQEKLPFKMKKDWELKGFENPESVVLDKKNNVLYVSNVNGNATDKDSNGFISKVSLEGTIIEKKWIDGLNAPKGLVIYKGKLYVTDIDEIVKINIKTKVKTIFKVKGATFLNDITVDKKGNIYASNTFGFSGIYKLKKGKKQVELWLKNENLNMPNGLYALKNKLFVASWGKKIDPKTYKTKILGNVLTVNLKNKKIKNITSPIGNLDGLSKTIHGFIISDWLSGKLLYFYFKNKKVKEVLDLPKGSADTYFDKKTKSVFIPLMLDNKLLKYHFKK